MTPRGKIPIAEGRRLSEKYKAPMLVVFSLHDGGDTFNVMTYGETKALCRHAADIGNKIAEAILGSKIAPAETEPMQLPNVPMEWNKAERGQE